MRIKRNVSYIVTAIMSISLLIPALGHAASQNECAIWICLPGGFPDGCSDAHTAMVKRVKKKKSPLPAFSECAREDENNKMSYDLRTAAYVPEHQVCTQYDEFYEYECLTWETRPEEYIKGKSCEQDDDKPALNDPPYCASTHSYIDIYTNNTPIGETYYWR